MVKRTDKVFLSALLLAITLLLAQCIFLYGNTGRDDAFFTYWPAHTLAEYGSILNYNGDRVEQSSTLLHTVFLASLHKILPPVAIPTLSWALSLTAGMLTLLATAITLRNRQVSAFAVLILATLPSLVFWASSGMETLNGAALFTAILFFCLQEKWARKNLCWLALATALAVLNRPETFIVLICFGLLAWLLQRSNHSQWITLLLSTLITAGLVSLWRHYYFDAWFPQPVTAKSSFNYLANTLQGIHYIVEAGESITAQCITAAGLLSFFLSLFYWRHPQRGPIMVSGSLALAQIAFILATGGDWMDATRFLLPVLPALFLCLVFFLFPWKKIGAMLLALLFCVALYDSWQFARQKSTGLTIHEREAALQRYLPDATTINNYTLNNHNINKYSIAELQTKDALRDIPQLEHLKNLVAQLDTYPEKLNIASIQMGFIPYHLSKHFSERLQFLDLRALSTSNLSNCLLLRDFPRTGNGIKISYDEFFALLPALNRQCGIEKPDIVYDLGYDMRQQVLHDNDYVITYREKRHVSGDFSKRLIGSELFVAVRRDLAAQFKLKDIHGNTPAMVETAISNPPNIILLMADDISYDHFGFMGNTAARTPTLDQLAQTGTVFTTGYVPTAFCRPSLATLLTGQWPHQNRIYANNGVNALQPGYTTLATLLQQRGYTTFAGGKFWEDEPELRGFDYFDTNKNTFARHSQNALWKFLGDAGEKPFFVWWAPMLPHTPHNPPQSFIDRIDENAIEIPASLPADKHAEYRSKTRNLLAMTLWMDDEIRKLHEKLSENNQLDNTLIVFLSDNGFSHRAISKSSPYELGLRTPIVFNWPKHIPAQKIDVQTSSINIYNTLLDYADVTHLPGNRLQPGHSLRPVLEQQAEPVSEKLFGADYQAVTIKTDPTPRPERDIYALHIRDGDWKYIFYLRDLREENNSDITIKSGMLPFPTRNAGDEEIYHLLTDPYEEKNLSAQTEQQQRIENYRREALQWWYSTGGKPFDSIKNCPAQPIALCGKILMQK